MNPPTMREAGESLLLLTGLGRARKSHRAVVSRHGASPLDRTSGRLRSLLQAWEG